MLHQHAVGRDQKPRAVRAGRSRRPQLVVSPLFRLVSKVNAQLKDVGPPEAVVESIGNFITGGAAGGRAWRAGAEGGPRFRTCLRPPMRASRGRGY